MANFIPKIEYTELTTGLAKSITFDSPPEGDPFNEGLKVSSTVTRSNNGNKQTQFNYIREEYNLEFIFQTKATKDAFKSFLSNHAFRGGKFNYFIHSDEVESEEFELDNRSVQFKRPIPDCTGDFEYDFKFKIDRVI